MLVMAAPAVRSADPPRDPKDPAKAEDRMRDEKRRDEQAARNHAVNVKVARFDSVWRVPRTNDIDVLPPGEPISRERKIIALLTFECEAQDETHAVSGIIVKAKDLGADAVMLLPFDPLVPTNGVIAVPSPRERRVFRANAIIYR